MDHPAMFNVICAMVLGVCAEALVHRIHTHIAQGAVEVDPVAEYTNSQISELIDDHIHNEKARAILKRRLIDGVCFEPLAEEFGLSVAQIKRIVYKGQENVLKYL